MKDIEQRIAQVRNDREHGSRWLVRETILIIRDLAHDTSGTQEERTQRLYNVGRQLALARPSMAALASAVGRMLNVQGGSDAVAQEGERLLREYDTAITAIANHAKPLLHGRLMTCSISGTVLEVLAACASSIEEVIVLEGRPRYEGRDTAQALRKQGIAVTLITDAQADIFMPQCDGVVVGADTLLANGDVLNKAGTALLGWSAQGHHVPFYILCETLKISPRRWSEKPEQMTENLALLEEKEPEEVLAQPITGVTVRNFYFDHTPHALVSKVITERGILDEATIRAIADQAKTNEEHLSSAGE